MTPATNKAREIAGGSNRSFPQCEASKPADKPRLLTQLADRLVRAGRLDEAERELQDHLANHPDANEVRIGLIDVRIARAAWSEALKVSAEGIERDVIRSEPLAAKIRQLASNERAVEALLGAGEHGEGPFASYLLGVLAAEVGRLDDAERYLRESYAGLRAFVPVRVAPKAARERKIPKPPSSDCYRSHRLKRCGGSDEQVGGRHGVRKGKRYEPSAKRI